MSTRLLVNATILNLPRQTGLGVYTANLLPPLLRLVLEDHRFTEVIIAGEPAALRRSLETILDTPRVRMHPIVTTHPVHRLIALDRMAVAERRRPGETVFYSPTHHGVVRQGLKQMITVHDLFARIFPGNYRQQYYYFRWYLPRVLANSRGVVADSGSTADDLRHFYRNCPPIAVVHAAIRADLSATPPTEISSLAGQTFFLFIGPSYRYKNCIRLIDAYAAFRESGSAKLVFVGGRETYLNEVKRYLRDTHGRFAGDIVFLEYASTSELAWLYRNAAALMITTRYEGFGLPALEAMACRCPVIASRAGSLPEVCGDAALYVDPEDVDQISRAMQKIASDGATRERLLMAGTQNARRFNWEISARKVYDNLVGCLQ